jgi:uncharacterized protein
MRQIDFHRPRMALALALAVAGAMPAAAWAEGATHDAPRSTMMITATGTASSAPDQASIVIGVEGVGLTAEEAMQDNTRKMTAVVATMEALGVEREDLATSGISLNPRYDHKTNATPRITGYHVSNRMTLTVDDIDALGAILDGIVSSGANTIQAITFDVADRSTLEKEARILAAQAAKEKASDYAAALGTEILGIVNVSETSRGYPTYRGEMMMMKASADSSGGPVPVAAGDVDVEIEINVTYELTGDIR